MRVGVQSDVGVQAACPLVLKNRDDAKRGERNTTAPPKANHCAASIFMPCKPVLTCDTRQQYHCGANARFGDRGAMTDAPLFVEIDLSPNGNMPTPGDGQFRFRDLELFAINVMIDQILFWLPFQSNCSKDILGVCCV